MKKGKYTIALFCNKKKKRYLYGCMKLTTIYEQWRKIRKEKKPRFVKMQSGKRMNEVTYEACLLFPPSRRGSKAYNIDELGRKLEIKLDHDTIRIKDTIPYWEEEKVYDFQTKKRISYDDLLSMLINVNEISQIFTLNNKLFLQIENDIKMFGNKNVFDSNRLFELIREDLVNLGKGNFLFVKDVTRWQRNNLYELLISKGFKKTKLFKHYSY